MAYFMNLCHYRDNHDTWLYYRDGKIFIIAQPYLVYNQNVRISSLTGLLGWFDPLVLLFVLSSKFLIHFQWDSIVIGYKISLL